MLLRHLYIPGTIRVVFETYWIMFSTAPDGRAALVELNIVCSRLMTNRNFNCHLHERVKSIPSLISILAAVWSLKAWNTSVFASITRVVNVVFRKPGSLYQPARTMCMSSHDGYQSLLIFQAVVHLWPSLLLFGQVVVDKEMNQNRDQPCGKHVPERKAFWNTMLPQYSCWWHYSTFLYRPWCQKQYHKWPKDFCTSPFVGEDLRTILGVQ